MMPGAVLLSALLMGLAGGPHCVAMCGAACAGIGRLESGGRRNGGAWQFQLGRLAGYSALGALAAGSIDGLGWLTRHAAAIRPVWTLFHVTAALLGLLLLWQARQPIWLEQAARSVWSRVRSLGSRYGRGAPLALGAAWAFMPCGLLYSALLLASLSGDALQGAAAMGAFAIASGVSLLAAPRILQTVRSRSRGDWGMRLAGLALFGTSAWALWMGLAHDAAPWCVAQ